MYHKDMSSVFWFVVAMVFYKKIMWGLGSRNNKTKKLQKYIYIVQCVHCIVRWSGEWKFELYFMKYNIKERNCTCTFLNYTMRIQPGWDDRMFGHLIRGIAIQILGLLCTLYSAEFLVCLFDHYNCQVYMCEMVQWSTLAGYIANYWG